MDECDQFADDIKEKLELLVNNELIPMLNEIKKTFVKRAQIFNIGRNFSHSIISDKLTITLPFEPPKKNDYTYSFGYNGTMTKNYVTLAAIFCSMIRMMIDFIKSDQEYLLWIQRKGNIVDRDKFIQLVNDCKSKQFDIVWLWTRKSKVFNKGWGGERIKCKWFPRFR